MGESGRALGTQGRYLVALLASSAGVVALLLFPEFFRRTPYLAAGSSSLLVLILAGVGPAVLTQVVTIFAAVHIAVEPYGAFGAITAGDIGRLVVFVGFLALADVLEWRHERTRADADARERVLRQTEARYRHVLEEASDGIVLAAPDGRLRLVNRRISEMLGYTGEELLRLPLASLYEPSDLVATPLGWDELTQASVLVRERRLRRKDGSTFVAELSVRRTADGLAHAIVRDITERKRAEEALRAERDLLEGILATSVAGILVVDPTGKILFANRQVETALGLAHARLIGLERFPEGWELLRPDGTPMEDRERATRQVVASGEPVYDARFILAPPGQPRRMLAVNAAPLKNPDGTITAAVLSVRDITEQDAVQRTLREREEQFRLITSTVPGVVYQYVVEPGGNERFTFVGGRASELLGASPEEILADRNQAWVSTDPEDRRLMAVDFNRVAQTLLPWSFDFRVRGPGGRLRWLRDIATAVPAENPRRVIWNGVIVDITDQRRLQEELLQSQKMDSLGRLAGGVAHDFNNLLTVIRGYADVLVGTFSESDPRLTEVREIRQAADRASSLTRQLLAVSRRQVLVPTEVDVNALVQEMERMLRRVIGENITIVLRPDVEVGMVRADPGQLEQVLLNLAVNARDAMPRGGTLTIETRRRILESSGLDPEVRGVAAGDYAELRVADTGVGIDRETQAKIFEPFFTTKPVGEGTGLGLSTVYGIVQQSSGAITVESTPGLGTSVRVFLPRLAERPPSAGPAVPARPAPRGGDRRATVLLVEDDDRVRQLTRRVLEQYGFGTMEARNGGEALALLDAPSRRVDAVVSDVMMPGMNGRELIGRLRLRRPDLPVLFLSGYTGEEVSEEVRAHSRQAFLQKPFSPEALAAALEDLLADRSVTPPATAG